MSRHVAGSDYFLPNCLLVNLCIGFLLKNIGVCVFFNIIFDCMVVLYMHTVLCQGHFSFPSEG